MKKYSTSFGLFLFFIFLLYIKISLIVTGNGFFDFLLSLTFIPIVIFLTFIATVINIRPKWNPKLFFVNLAIGIFIIVVYSLFINKNKIYKLDWELNRNNRETIIELIKNRKLTDQKIPDSLRLKMNCSPNEFKIQTKTDSTLTVLFYTDFGLNDHYSGFIYSNDSFDLKQLNEKVINGGNDYKISENWFELNE